MEEVLPRGALTLAADRRGVYFYDGERIVGLGRDQGEPRWKSGPISRRPAIAVYYAPNLVVSGDVVLFAGGDRSMTAVAGETGKTLWTASHPPSGYCSAEDLFVVRGSVWAGAIPNSAASGIFTQRDLQSGRIVRSFPPDDKIYHFPHHRCYRAKATDQYILASRTGIEMIDTQSGHWTDQHWVRGGCLYGVMPCNGLVYTPPHYCACFVTAKLNGFCALAPESAGSRIPGDAANENRLEKGPAYGQEVVSGQWPVVSKEAGISNPHDHAAHGARIPNPSDWPTYRHDAARSGATPVGVPAELRVGLADAAGGPDHGARRWPATRCSSPRSTPTRSTPWMRRDGSRRWSFTAGGRVDSPPTIHDGRVLFGSADGWVYCLRASDGQLVWRFRAAPEQRRIMASGQSESAWPVHGSVLVPNGSCIASRGASMFLDGGLRCCGSIRRRAGC